MPSKDRSAGPSSDHSPGSSLWRSFFRFPGDSLGLKAETVLNVSHVLAGTIWVVRIFGLRVPKLGLQGLGFKA